MKCDICGGDCVTITNGKYQCTCCRNIFTKENSNDAKEDRESVSFKMIDDSQKGASVFEKNIYGVLEIIKDNSRASGYLIDSDGFAITNAHAVALENGKSCRQCIVKVAGESVYATIVAMGTENKEQYCSNADLALIKLTRVPEHATPLQFCKTGSVRTGERIFVIGNSLGEGICITSGIISDNNRDGQLMYDCPTNPGNSGGPVFNTDGQVIGTHVAGKKDHVQGMNYAIPFTAVLAFIDKAKSKV